MHEQCSIIYLLCIRIIKQASLIDSIALSFMVCFRSLLQACFLIYMVINTLEHMPIAAIDVYTMRTGFGAYDHR